VPRRRNLWQKDHQKLNYRKFQSRKEQVLGNLGELELKISTREDKKVNNVRKNNNFRLFS